MKILPVTLSLIAVFVAVSTDLPAKDRAAATAAPRADEVRQIDWETLLPAKERESYTPSPPPPVHDYLGEGDMAALQSGSFDVNAELNGARVKLPGFIVPLERDASGLVSEFFLVPYFGACIHVPPPPPNQIVYVRMHAGAGLDSIEEAQWVTGTLHTAIRKSALGSAAYTLEGEKLEPYDYTQH